MGKGLNKQAAAAVAALALFLSGCGFKKPSGFPYILYSGRFLAISSEGEKSSGRWEAICSNGRITKVYLYNPLGFPLAEISIENGQVKSSKKIPKDFEQLILELSEKLPTLYERSKSNVITIEKPGLGILKIRVEGARRVPSP